MRAAQLDLERTLLEAGALLEGHFALSSGRHSDRFIQKFRILEDPSLLDAPARAIAEHFRPMRPSVVVSAAVGGILLGYEVARHLGTKAIFTEKVNGAPVLRRGFTLAQSDRALVVEDVITTGLSVRETIGVARGHGAEVIGVGALVVREPITLAVPVYALLELPLQSYLSNECPRCADGEPLTDPGSRRVG
ncbi:MAG: orotate phosphoribosyltransferase [Candidatus Eremiobacteraeota bacterium]|nr:orotate phosphoribosyltransferase [Candidatus Eremiobacteraeota bacterium]MBV9263835.1 orotate phosphoribosyltransferase [Candidatus Eremiobacteraeota bacterium]